MEYQDWCSRQRKVPYLEEKEEQIVLYIQTNPLQFSCVRVVRGSMRSAPNQSHSLKTLISKFRANFMVLFSAISIHFNIMNPFRRTIKTSLSGSYCGFVIDQSFDFMTDFSLKSLTR